MFVQKGLPIAQYFLLFENNFDQQIEHFRSWISASKATPPYFELGEQLAVPRAAPRARSRKSDPKNEAITTEVIDPHEDRVVREQVDSAPRWMFRPSVEFALLSSLWIERVGIKLENLQSNKHSYGNRLRLKNGKLHRHGSSFRQYIADYTRWRDNGLRLAASEIAKNKRTVISTFDVQNFYGSLNAEFLRSSKFLQFAQSNGVKLSSSDLALTSQLIEAIQKAGSKGLPIGLPASAVIANAALSAYDNVFSKMSGIIYYGRYVDDFIIVQQTTSQTQLQPDALIQHYQPDYLESTRHQLRTAPDKTRNIELSPPYAKTLLDELRASFAHFSSEWRTLPSVESLRRLENMVVETRSGRRIRPELREADTLSAQRWTLSSLLARYGKFVAGLRASDWAPLWRKTYNRLAPIVVAAANIPSTSKHLREFIALCLMSGDNALSKDLGRRLKAGRRFDREDLVAA